MLIKENMFPEELRKKEETATTVEEKVEATTVEETVEKTEETTVTTENPEIKVEENQQPTEVIETKSEETQKFELNDESVLSFIREKSGKDFKNINEIFEPKEVNPYENVSEEVKTFLKYHAETGRGFSDYQKLNQDLSTIPDIELARERVRQETGLVNLPDNEIDDYLMDQLGVDLEEMTASDKIKLAAYTKSIREVKLQEQEKYKAPLEDRGKKQEVENNADYVQLENGQKIKKADYDVMVDNRNNYLSALKNKVASINESVFEVVFDENGSEKKVQFPYQYSVEDKQQMLSYAGDLDGTLNTLFSTEENGLNHEELMQGVWWADRKNRDKAIAALINKAVAENTVAITKTADNIKLGINTSLPSEGKDNIKKVVPISGNQSGFGIKVPISLPNP
jgi:hypothetical protein